MLGARVSVVRDISPLESWSVLKANPHSYLVDVRTRFEWYLIGTPETAEPRHAVIFVEWAYHPDMRLNPNFVEEINKMLNDIHDDKGMHDANGENSKTERPKTRLMFICRTGGRSLAAAQAMQTWGDENGHDMICENVANGFEGVLDENNRRGKINGWKAEGLPWRQS